jgi:hypothetical protein
VVMDQSLVVCSDGMCRPEASILIHISLLDLVPGPSWHPSVGRRCLSDEVQTVQSKLEELAAAGDRNEAERWLQERRRFVCKKYEVCSIFVHR